MTKRSSFTGIVYCTKKTLTEERIISQKGKGGKSTHHKTLSTIVYFSVQLGQFVTGQYKPHILCKQMLKGSGCCSALKSCKPQTEGTQWEEIKKLKLIKKWTVETGHFQS